jgi:hypothetical protein
MYYKKYKPSNLTKFLFGKYLSETKFTRKNWNIQKIGYSDIKLKKIMRKRIRKQNITNGNYYRKVNDYQWQIN